VSIIEQAAQRLKELHRSGIEVPRAGANATVDAMTHGMPLAAPADAPQEPVPGSRRVEIDPAALERAGYVVPAAPRTRLADEFRAIKRPLLANVRGQGAAPVHRANCIMVTSAGPGEGKTFTAINLAISLAMEVDAHVLLVDADVVRPSVLARLGLPDNPGLLDKLRDPAVRLNDLFLRTNIEKLSLLPAGQANERATELLASGAMGGIMEELATRYSDRIIIFDAPPLLAAPETRALAAHVGQIIVVVDAQTARRKTVVDALAVVESCPVVMTLLNKVTGSTQPGYGYGYGG
jgi:protein-tyrosine kinase